MRRIENVLFILTIILIAYTFASFIILDSNERMAEYNYHMCVETYGLNEQCR